MFKQNNKSKYIILVTSFKIIVVLTNVFYKRIKQINRENDLFFNTLYDFGNVMFFNCIV